MLQKIARWSLVAFAFAGLLPAQSSFTAAVRGVVSDATGAAVPGARVIVTEAERNVQHVSTTDEAGRYVLTALQPGSYRMVVEAQGFKRTTKASFPLAVQQQATFDFSLEVGDITTSVSVEGRAALLNTTISTLGQVIENRYMLSLPNIGRNPLSLLNLTPGVVGAAGTVSPSNTNFVANGTRNSTSDVLVDGAIVNTTEQNSGATDLKWTPSVDSVQEFKMQTNFFAAEYAQSGGAIVNMVTKSGTNEIHGTGYYFLRDSTLNANSWSANRNGSAIPYYHRNQLGGNIGGPIRKNKTFFFATYEYTKSKSPSSQTATFPTMEQRNGDFSKTLFSNGQLISIFNPFDTFKDASGAVKRTPFPGNIIPKSMMDPVALKGAQYYPAPNQDPNPVTHINNWFQQDIGESHNLPVFDFKGDHVFTDRLRFTGRYSVNFSASSPANLFGASNAALSGADPYNGPSQTKTQTSTGNLTFAQNATTIWTATYGFVYSNYNRDPFVNNVDLTSFGLPKSMQDLATYHMFPMFSAGGYSDIGTQGYWKMDRQEGVHQFSGSLTKVKGAHNIKAGAEFRRNFLDYAQPGYPSGHFTFGAQTTSQDLFAGSSTQGNGFASMLLGFGNGSNFHIDPKAFSRAGYWGTFVQDDWKITRKLTLNLGLRYEMELPRTEVLNRYSYWDLNQKSPLVVPGFDLKGVMKFVGGDTRSPFDKDRNNFAPRLGFAYAANNKTSIRAGAGMFYLLSRATVAGHTGAAFNTDASIPWTLDSGATRNATLSNPYPQGILTPPGGAAGDATFIGLGVGTITRRNSNPQMYSWNFSIQREVGWNSVLEVNYTGSRGVHLYSPYTSLSPLPLQYWNGPNALTRTQLNAAVPNPFFGYITEPKAVNLNGRTIQQYRLFRNMPQYDGVSGSDPNTADSNYHGMQVKLEKRFSSGLSLLTHYTWSKMIDDVSVTDGNLTWLGGSTSLQNPLNFAGERSLSQHDVKHRFVLTGAYELPFGQKRRFGSNMNRLTDAVLGGWELSGFATLQSGFPLQVSQSGGTLWNGTQRPNLVGDPATSGDIYSRLNGYFNQSSFTRPNPDVFGSAARVLNIRGPGVKMMDLALLKNWRIKEKQSAQFRLEASNALNHPIFSDPPTAYGASNFGVISGTKVGSRSVQLGFKYYF